MFCGFFRFWRLTRSIVTSPIKLHFLRTALVLGLLPAIGPFAIDMYLPALPSIGQL